MLKFILSPFFLLLLITGVAQNTKNVDSLLKALDTETEDSILLKTNAQLGEYYMDNNSNKAITFFTKNIELCKKLNKELNLANTFYSIGFCNLVAGKYDIALDNYLQSARIYEKRKDNRRLANAYMSIGNVYFQNKNLVKTNEYYNKAEAINSIIKDSFQLASIYSERGILNDQLKQFDSAIFYQNKSLLISKDTKDNYGIGNSFSNIGLALKHRGDAVMALQAFDSALFYFNKLEDVPIDILAAMYNNIAATHTQLKNYEAALSAFEKSLAYSKTMQSKSVELENYKNLATLYESKKDYVKELFYIKKYYNLKDSIFNTDTKTQLTQLEADYQIEKKNIEIERNKSKIAQQKNQRNIFILLTTSALIVLAGLSYFYQKIKKNNQKITAQKNELEKLNLVKDKLFSVLSHDLRNPLATLQTYLLLQDSNTISVEKKEVYKLQTTKALAETSNMLDNLLVWANMQLKNTPLSLIPISLTNCITDAISNVQAQATQKNITISPNESVSTLVSDYNTLLIILRNILTNAIKYSHQNSTITIATKTAETKVFIEIRDTGIGLSEQQITSILHNESTSALGTNSEKGNGLGLFLVQDLLPKLNATLQIESEIGKGSSFILLFKN